MSESILTCPCCGRTSTISHFNAGWSDSYVLRCDSCSKLTLVPMYGSEIDKMQSMFGLHSDELYRNLSEAIESCECGGVFCQDASPRCVNCKQELELDLLKEVVGWPMRSTSCPTFVTTGNVEFKWKQLCAGCGKTGGSQRLVDDASNTYLCEDCE